MRPLISSFVAGAVTLMAVSGCGGPGAARILADVESYMETRPDSARAVLESIDTASLRSDRLRAEYAILHTMSIDKCYIDTTDLSLIMPAVRYYSRHGGAAGKMKSLYYLGRIQYNSENYPAALLAETSALEYAERIGDLYWRAMATSLIAYVHNATHNSSDELDYMKRAFTLWKEYGDSVHIRFAIQELAISYHNNKCFDKADSTFAILTDGRNQDTQSLVYRAENEVMRGTPDAGKALDWFETAMAGNADMETRHYYEYAFALSLAGRTDEAHAYLDALEEYPYDVQAIYYRYRIARNEKDFETAMKYYRSYNEYSDSVVCRVLEQSIFKAAAESQKDKAEIARERSRTSLLGLVAVVLLAGTVILSLTLAFRRRREKLEMEAGRMSLLYSEATRMIQDIRTEGKRKSDEAERKARTAEERLTTLRTTFAKHYQAQFSMLGRLLEPGSSRESILESASRKYNDEIHRILSSIRDGDSGRREFEAIIDSELDGIMSKLRRDYPALKERDFTALSYIIVGFDAITRAFLMDSTSNNMRVLKNRLTKYIVSNPTPNLGLYLAFLHPRTAGGSKTKTQP